MRSGERLAVLLLAVLTLVLAPASASVTFVSSSPQTIARGDTVTISGTGATNGSMAVWVIGRDYFTVITADPDGNGNYSFVLLPDATFRFSSGQYSFVLQDPGANQKPELGAGISDTGNITFSDRGALIVDIGPKQGIRADAEPVVKELGKGTSLPGVDDILTPFYLFVEEPAIHFDQKPGADPDSQLPRVTAGERVAISGTTNMGVENLLHADVRNLETNTFISSVTVPVIAGIEKNRWAFELDTTGFSPGEYYITVGWMKSDTTGTGSTILTVAKPSVSSTPDAGGPIPPPVLLGAGVLLVTGIVVISLRKR